MSDNWSENQSQSHTADSPAPDAGALMRDLVKEIVTEKRRARRWGGFFKALLFLYLFLILGFMLGFFDMDTDSAGASLPHTAVIDIDGEIGADQPANAENIIRGMRKALKNKQTKALVLRINSPGGSPVQAGYVFDEIQRQKTLHPDIPIYAVISDIGASGAYYIAAAATEIYADKASLVGSIGVISSGFGFVESLKKLGITRRLYTAGEHKAFLDPFSPEQKGEAELWQQVLKSTHKQFIESVKKGRGKRLKEDPQLFTGLVWTGEQALGLGLVDGLGSADFVARKVVGQQRIVNYTESPNKWEQLVNKLGASFGAGLIKTMGLTPSLR